MMFPARRIKREAKKWDAYIPDWWKHINEDTLDLTNGINCVVGQVSWNMNLSFPIVLHRFMKVTNFPAYTQRGCERYWIKEIKRRRAMEIGKPEKEITVTPAEEPVPEVIPMEEPAPAKAPSREREKEPIEV